MSAPVAERPARDPRAAVRRLMVHAELFLLQAAVEANLTGMDAERRKCEELARQVNVAYRGEAAPRRTTA